MSDQIDIPEEYRDIPRELLKHGKGRFKDVILVPQPSDSPNDPLNVMYPKMKCREGFLTKDVSGHNGKKK